MNYDTYKLASPYDAQEEDSLLLGDPEENDLEDIEPIDGVNDLEEYTA